MEVKVEKDKKENYPVFLDGETVGGKVRNRCIYALVRRINYLICFHRLI
jgi:hypothetical protein